MKARLPYFALLAGLAAIYFAAGKLGMYLEAGRWIASPVWPPTGLACGAMLLLGYRIWPAVALGAFLVNITGLPGLGTHSFATVAASAGIAMGNTLEALAGTWLVNRFAQGSDAFRQPRTILLFAVLAGVLSTLLSATTGVMVSLLAGIETWGQAGSFWFVWWLGDMASALILAPLIVVWGRERPPRLSRRRWLEAAMLMATLVVFCQAAFGEWFVAQTRGTPLSFLVLPVLLWTTLRFGQRATTTVTFIVACLAIAATLDHHGPFVLSTRGHSLLLLENFLLVITLLSLMLTADVRQRGENEAAWRASEQRYRDLFNYSPQPMWVIDHETLRFLAVNAAAIREYGYSRAEFLSLALAEIWAADEPPNLPESTGRARDGLPVPKQARHRKKDGTIIDVEIARHNLIVDGRPAAIVLSTDITQRLKAERRAAAFSELGRRLSVAGNPREAAQTIADAASALLGWDACLLELGLPEQEGSKTVFCMDTVAGRRTEITPSSCQLGPLTLRTLEHGAQLILRPVVAPAAGGAEPQPASDDAGRLAPDGRAFGDRNHRSASLLFVPVRHDQQTLGVFSIQSYTPNAYTAADLQLLQALADHCGGALERIRAQEEIRRLNEELRRRLEELQTIFDTAPVGLAVAHDPECRVITVNPACAAILGTNSAGNISLSNQDTGKSFRFMRDGQEVPGGEFPMQVAAQAGSPVPAQELEIELRDGLVISSYVSATPLYDQANRVRGSLGVLIDLTERKRHEAALGERDERLRLALAASRMGTWTIELQPEPRVHSSPELDAIFGLKAGESAGTQQALFELIHPEDHRAVRKAIARAIAGDGDQELEFRFLPRHQPEGWLLARGRAYRDANGIPTRVVGVAIDITARKQTENTVRQLNADLERRVNERTSQLQAINKELEAFSYSVSHDLRAPLRSIRGFTEVLLHRYADQIDERGKEFLRRICESSQHMDRLIEDLLQLSRLGRVALQPRTVDLAALARSITTELRKAEPKRAAKFVIAPELHAKGDERLLRLVLENLLRNAWKFSAKQLNSRIEVGQMMSGKASSGARASQAGRLESAFFVRDNGAGFDMAHADKLFGPFQRLHSAVDFPGTGVGLATVQRIVNRHGGRVWAEGGVNRGATFYFTLPSYEDT